jgi:hypothetical protein
MINFKGHLNVQTNFTKYLSRFTNCGEMYFTTFLLYVHHNVYVLFTRGIFKDHFT